MACATICPTGVKVPPDTPPTPPTIAIADVHTEEAQIQPDPVPSAPTPTPVAMHVEAPAAFDDDQSNIHVIDASDVEMEAEPQAQAQVDDDEFSLPELEQELQKEGSIFSLVSPAIFNLSHGVLSWRRRSNSPQNPQSIILQHASVELEPERLCIRVSNDGRRCGIVCHNANQFSIWANAIERSAKWSLISLYDRQRKLASGASSTVYVAKRRRTGAVVALKSVNHDQYRPQEVAILRAPELRHSNLLCAVDVMADAEYLHIVQPLMNGGSVRDMLEKAPKGLIPEYEARRIMRAVLHGLQHLHTNGVVHRDIKPDNVLLCGDQVRIGDFGLATYVRELNQGKYQMVGTPNYAAPEVFRKDKLGTPCDMWSFGVMLFEMLTGNLPFAETTFELLSSRIKANIFEIAHMRNASASREACSLVLQLLTKKSEKRLTAQTALQHEWFNM